MTVRPGPEHREAGAGRSETRAAYRARGYRRAVRGGLLVSALLHALVAIFLSGQFYLASRSFSSVQLPPRDAVGLQVIDIRDVEAETAAEDVLEMPPEEREQIQRPEPPTPGAGDRTQTAGEDDGFGLTNAAILAVISLQYLSGWSGASSPLAWLYLVTIYISHYAWMTLLPMILVGLPVILLRPRRGLLTALGVLLASLMVALITLDSLLWSQSHFHINLLTARILGPQSWIFVGVMFVIALLFESMLARSTWGWIGKRPRRGGRAVAAVVVLSLLLGYFIGGISFGYYSPRIRNLTKRTML